ncbi:LOW QUALITY PROTEIN: antigen WC1.1-like [Geothlypis trichas]
MWAGARPPHQGGSRQARAAALEPRGMQEGPRRAGAVGGLSPPEDIRVAAHCGEVCDGRGAGEAHIWARSRLLEAAAPQPGDEAPDKGCPPARCCCCCVHWLGRWQRCPGCAGWGPVAMGPLLALGLLVCVRLCGGSGELRLVGGGGRCAGRVEVKHDGEWGSVCAFDFDWEARWAVVVCRQLGCGRVARASLHAPFGQGSGRIELQPFFCRGTEDALEHCPHFGWKRNSCGHEWDVGVTCTDALELRLAGSSSPCAGRVEVKLQGHWGSVADDSWDMEDAEVVCQQLGCGSASAAYYTHERFGVVDGVVSLALVDCRGDEATLWDCKIRGWGPYNSSVHDMDAAVVCQGFSQLVGGDGACAGRLEVRQGRAWVGVCEDQVDMEVAQVVCRELGCGEVIAIPSSGRFGAESRSLWDGGFQCNGSEPLLSACARRPARSQGCSGPGSVICSSYTGFQLRNGSSGCSGRVEVAVSGTWGSVCASEWDLPDAHVLCRHLGCGRAFSVPPGGSFGSGEGPLRPDAFGCSGSERHPGQCPVAVLGKPPCVPGNAAAVNCSGAVESLRLVKGENRCEGFLEVKASTGDWRRVPGEVVFVRNLSNVCWKLGCGELEKSDVIHGNSYLWDIIWEERNILEGVIDTILNMTTDLATKTELGDYYERNLEYMTTDLAGNTHGTNLVCSGSLQVRLVGSSGRCAGRVEVYSRGSWSWVCQEGWELQDAAVVCRELGCGTALQAPGWARLGAGTGLLWPYSPDCSGSEESLWECGRTERRECGRGGGAGAVCSEQLSVRLAGGSGRCRGFLEISYNGTWGRVCANGTSNGTAATVCRQLGCGDRGWLTTVPVQEPPKAWLAWVGCEDGARSLWQCPSAPWQLQSCGTDGHAHVECEDSDGTAEGHTTPYPEGAASTGVPSRRPPAVGVGSVPVPTVLCVVLGTLLCLSLGALALLLCRARARRRGPGRAADAISNAVYEELDYKAMREYQEVPTPPGSLLEGWVKKLPYDTGGSVEGSDTEAGPDPPAWSEQGPPDGYDDVLDVLPTGGISFPPGPPGTTKDPSEQPPGHMDYDDVGNSALGTTPPWQGSRAMAPALRHVVPQEVPDVQAGLQSPEGVSSCSRAWLNPSVLNLGVEEAGAEEKVLELVGREVLKRPRCRCGPAFPQPPLPGSGMAVAGGRAGERGARGAAGPAEQRPCRRLRELRLVGGGGRCAGRVEVKHDGEWGSVCAFDFDWEARWAVVVCRQLGCGRVARASLHAPFGQGSGRIELQPFFCRGTEDALEHCPHFGWKRNSCGHEWDVGVTCTDALELRLAGGGSPCAGRVEVKLQGHWGTVADDSWDMEDAEVVCQQLGCGSASAAYYTDERFGIGDGLVSLALVDCRGDEATLWDCKIRGWGPYNSSVHDMAAAVVCQGFCQLVGGDGACAGRLEVRQGRAWVGVCEDQVDMEVAQVVCRELGCGEVIAIPSSGRFGAESGSLWDGGFQCNGSEPLLSACARRPARSQGCSGPGSVICSSYTGFRLQNGSSGCSGRVEVAVRGTWGSVCASEWDLPDAHVLCRHLGCGRAFSVPPGGSFGSGEGPLRPDAFGCSGSERHPGQCPVAVLGKPPCAPGNAAAVNCSGAVESLRLVKGETRCEGFLEVKTSTGDWRRVPGEVSFLHNLSNVCCKLGCGELEKSDVVYGNSYLWEIKREERNILESVIDTILNMTTDLVSNTILGDYYWRNVEYMTTGPADKTHGTNLVCSGSLQVRLVGSSGRCAGRVEVYSRGSWSWVCQEGWELQDAAVVCRELGCGTALQAPGWARLGAGTGPLWPYSPDCSGSEESLWQCGRTERRECGRGGGAGAVCSEQLSVRLAGGSGRCRGFLEISYNGTWGRVCANGTSLGTAATVCRQLGCGDRGWLTTVPVQEPPKAWLAWVGCEDGARSLWQCPSAPWQLQSCGTDGHAHVECEDSGGTAEGHTTQYPEGAASTGVPSRRPPAVGVGSVPVPTVLCVVLGTLLCLSLGALALLLCRARARRRGPGRAADAISNAVYEELDYKAMCEYQEVPTPPGSLLEGWVKKLPYDTGGSVERSDTEAGPAWSEQGPPDGYDDVLDVPQEPPAASNGDISEAMAGQRWICVLPTGTFLRCPQGGISSPPSLPGATRDPSEQLPGHMDYDDVGNSALGTLP